MLVKIIDRSLLYCFNTEVSKSYPWNIKLPIGWVEGSKGLRNKEVEFNFLWNPLERNEMFDAEDRNDLLEILNSRLSITFQHLKLLRTRGKWMCIYSPTQSGSLFKGLPCCSHSPLLQNHRPFIINPSGISCRVLPGGQCMEHIDRGPTSKHCFIVDWSPPGILSNEHVITVEEKNNEFVYNQKMLQLYLWYNELLKVNNFSMVISWRFHFGFCLHRCSGNVLVK